MREDMAKVIVERPRRAQWGTSKAKNWSREYQRHWALDTLPVKEAMKRPHIARKSLNENLKPLWRFLLARLGRSWNTVFAEICENLDRNSAVQKHIFEHIEGFVELNPVFDEENVACRGGYATMIPLTSQDFYVHRGILCRGEALTHVQLGRKRRAARRQAYITLGDNQLAIRDANGVWFEVTLAPAPKDGDAWDAWYRCHCYRVDSVVAYGRKAVYARSKRAMNTKEIAALSL